MNLAHLLSFYLNINLLLLVALCGLGLSQQLAILAKNRRFSARAKLKLHYGVLSFVLLLAAAQPLIPGPQVFAPAVRLWSAPSLKEFHQKSSSSTVGFVSVGPAVSAVPAGHAAGTWLMLILILGATGILTMIRDLRNLRKIRRTSLLLRRIGKVQILLSEESRIPFSYWLPGQANVVLSGNLHPRDYRLTIAHELQHHRQGDTRWIYLLWALKLVNPFNPAIYFWTKWISEIQEFACDETLVDHKKVESRQYARCLFEVAKTASHTHTIPACATGLTPRMERNILKRRIQEMTATRKLNSGRSITCAMALATIAAVTTASFAAKNLVQDRRISITQANEMARNAQSKDGFPIVVNDLVLTELNRYIGTPEGREFIREALVRKENYREMISAKLKHYGSPAELMAIPIVESGYRNLPETGKPGWGAGLWMFIKSTAKNFGIDNPDDRLNEKLETDAAIRYLESLHLRFNDWLLAVMAYNVGEGSVQTAIDETGSRDAWVLVRHGLENDRAYLARVMAAIIILKNPQALQ